MRLAGQGHALPFWVIADSQTAGRGRRGRIWLGGEGDFFGSAALHPGEDPGFAALRSFTAALALADGLVGLGISRGDVSLKWPNDVLLRGRKVAGILLESTRQSGRLVLVVGIGVNLAHAPSVDEVEPEAFLPISLAELGVDVTPDVLLDTLAVRFAEWDARLMAEGFEPIRQAWLSRAARLGEVITARLPGREITGVFETVDAEGAVVLKTARGRQHLPAADIFF